MGALTGADVAAELFLTNGIDRWEKQGRINHGEAAGLRTRLSSGTARYATRRPGAHLVLSVAIAVPAPGVWNAARFLWTFSFWLRVQIRRLLRKNAADADGMSNIHKPLVMFLSLLPGLGGVVYLASSPLRSKLLDRLMLDQVAWKLPFKLYRRTHIGRLLAPPVNLVLLPNTEVVPGEV